jgi:hypothetical protein
MLSFTIDRGGRLLHLPIELVQDFLYSWTYISEQ